MTTHLMTVVAVALLNDLGQVLLAQRPADKWMAGMWEFPGGKVDPGETPEQALIRECQEELGITLDLDAIQPYTFISHPYPEKNFHLLMPLYLCRSWTGELRGMEKQNLDWVYPRDMLEYLITPADLPLVKALQNGLQAV